MKSKSNFLVDLKNALSEHPLPPLPTVKHPSLIKSTTVTPAHNRSYVTARAALFDFSRGLDFLHQGETVSIRNFVPATCITIKYGKQLQKETLFIVPTPTKARNKAETALATLQVSRMVNSLQAIDTPGQLTIRIVRRIIGDYTPTEEEIMLWVEQGRISSICAEMICKLKSLS